MGQMMRVVVGWSVVVAALGCGPRREPPRDEAGLSQDPATQPTTMPVTMVEVPPSTGPATQEAMVLATQPATTQATTQAMPATTQAVEASTGPATTQALSPAESPRQVLAGVMNRTFRGDAEGVRQRLHVAGDESQRLADAMADVATAAAKVHAAAAAKFGAEEAKKLDIEIVPAYLIASAEEKVDGERSTVKLRGQNGNGIAFQKIDGTWKMSLPELIESQKQGRSIDQLVNDTRSPVGRFEDLAKRVNEGQFQNAEQLLAELAQTFFSSQQR